MAQVIPYIIARTVFLLLLRFGCIVFIVCLYIIVCLYFAIILLGFIAKQMLLYLLIAGFNSGFVVAIQFIALSKGKEVLCTPCAFKGFYNCLFVCFNAFVYQIGRAH